MARRALRSFSEGGLMAIESSAILIRMPSGMLRGGFTKKGVENG